MSYLFWKEPMGNQVVGEKREPTDRRPIYETTTVIGRKERNASSARKGGGDQT